MLLLFDTRVSLKSTVVENHGEISHFLTHVKFTWEIGEMSESTLQVERMFNPTCHIMWQGDDAWPSARLEVNKARRAANNVIVTSKYSFSNM